MAMITRSGYYNGRFRKAGQHDGADDVGSEATDLDRMTKSELIAEAARRNVAIDPSATKANILAVLSGT